MQELQNISRAPDVSALIDRLLPDANVAGIALGVDTQFLQACRDEFGPRPQSDYLRGPPPRQWGKLLASRGDPETTSPIHVIVYVLTDPDDFQAAAKVAPAVGGHPVLIERHGPFHGLDHARHRPVKAGVSTGNASRNDAGTVGGFLKTPGTADVPYLSSCHHVLVDSGGGTDVVQQGIGDGGNAPKDVIGSVSHVVPLVAPAGFTSTSPYNMADAALTLCSGVSVTRTPRKLNKDVTSFQLQSLIGIGDDIVFVGKESDDRRGFVHRFVARVKVTLDSTVYLFGDVFEIKTAKGQHPQPGDSGAWVLHERGTEYEAYGQVFAGDPSSPTCALCGFMETILQELKSATGDDFDIF